VPTGRKCARVPEYLVAKRAFEIGLQFGTRVAHSERSCFRIIEHGTGEPRRMCRRLCRLEPFVANASVVWARTTTHGERYVS
jgi:hypothetical protein